MEDINNVKGVLNSGTFYRGVVEDNNDPVKLNRVRVRVMGIHSDTIPTDVLPWAEVLGSNLFGMSSGVGITGLPVQGSYVWIFFEGEGYETPIVMGTCYGVSKTKETGGFTDPKRQFPIADRLGEPDTNRLARNEVLSKTQIGDKVNYRETGIPTSEGNSWDEPVPLNYKTKYPDNTVIETKSGHIVEIDDTPGNERIHIYHRSGTYVEFLPDGSTVNRVNGDAYNIIKENLNEYIEGNKSETVAGSTQELVSGNQHSMIGDNKYLKVGSSMTNIVGTDIEVIAGGNITESAASNIKISAGGSIALSAATVTYDSNGTMKLTGSRIDLN